MKIYCEKCQSENTDIVDITPQSVEDKKISIADFNGFPTTSDLVYRPKTYLIRCRECGNKKEITQ